MHVLRRAPTHLCSISCFRRARPLPPRARPACNPRADEASLRESYSDASYFKDEALRAFKLGVVGLEERAQVGLWGARERACGSAEVLLGCWACGSGLGVDVVGC